MRCFSIREREREGKKREKEREREKREKEDGYTSTTSSTTSCPGFYILPGETPPVEDRDRVDRVRYKADEMHTYIIHTYIIHTSHLYTYKVEECEYSQLV